MYDLNTVMQMLQRAMQSPEFQQAMSRQPMGVNGVSGQTFSNPQMPLDPTFQMETNGMPGGGVRPTTGSGGEGIGYNYTGATPTGSSTGAPTMFVDPRQASAGGRNTNYTGYGNLYQPHGSLTNDGISMPTAGTLPGQFTGGTQGGMAQSYGSTSPLSGQGQSGLPNGAKVYTDPITHAFVQDYSQVKPLSGMFSPDNKSYTTGGDNGVTVGTDSLEALHNNGVAGSQVNNAFLQYLGRQPTIQDRDYYDNLLGSSGDPTSVINGIKNSAEAQTFGASGQPNQYQGYLDAYNKNAADGAFDWKVGK